MRNAIIFIQFVDKYTKITQVKVSYEGKKEGEREQYGVWAWKCMVKKQQQWSGCVDAVLARSNGEGGVGMGSETKAKEEGMLMLCLLEVMAKVAQVWAAR